jgi:hypothetical protein
MQNFESRCVSVNDEEQRKGHNGDVVKSNPARLSSINNPATLGISVVLCYVSPFFSLCITVMLANIWRGYLCDNTLLQKESVTCALLLVAREQEGALLLAR